MALIELNDVSLTFNIRKQGRVSFKEFVLRKGVQATNPVLTVEALSHVNMSVREGDRLGIVGHNGAGKSTLLKLLAGIYPPTSGTRTVEGHISSLFDISLGFEPEASGWENICYRGYLQGETPQTIRAKMQPIAEFSELGRFLDMPVRYYSAGMMVRLAFSIATAIEPEILLVDEVLSAGDLAFQAKARQRMYDMIAKARLIVMVSHDLDSLGKLCEYGIWMDHGKVRMTGTMEEVILAYHASAVDAPRPDAPVNGNRFVLNGIEHPANGDGHSANGNGHAVNGNGNGHAKKPDPAHGNGHPRDGSGYGRGPNEELPAYMAPEKHGPRDLRLYEQHIRSQFGEDGILEEILKRIGTTNRHFVELSARIIKDGGNCTHLAMDNRWTGLFVETEPDQLGVLESQFKDRSDIRCSHAEVTPENVEALLSNSGVPSEFDVLSIDLDGNDYWVWAAVENWRPRIVVIEYNASHPPSKRWVMKEDREYRWNGTSYFGASLASLTALAKRKGYVLVGTTSLGVNAFFVAEELVTPERFLDPVVHYYYSPPNYGPYYGGHPPGEGPFVEV
jgi:ABC-type polysaccharide/polyol phosphate transport system ATPase subunit